MTHRTVKFNNEYYEVNIIAGGCFSKPRLEITDSSDNVVFVEKSYNGMILHNIITGDHNLKAIFSKISKLSIDDETSKFLDLDVMKPSISTDNFTNK